jgi:hypothetical protein
MEVPEGNQEDAGLCMGVGVINFMIRFWNCITASVV